VRNLLQRVMRGLPRFPGKLRVAKVLLGNLEGPGRVRDRFGFTYEVSDLREPIAFHLLINGSYEPETQDLLLRVLPAGGVLIDVGANIGTFTIPAAKHVRSSGCVIAIEASREVFNVLQKNIDTNRVKNVQLVCAAASATAGDVEFYPAPADHFGMGSRAPQFNAAPMTIPSVTLDSLVQSFSLSSVDLIKIDVEGFEVDVLKGATGLLNGKNPPLIIFEFCDWAETRSGEDPGAAQRFLLECGFQVWRASEYGHGSPITKPLTTDAEMLVARR
jgi:FkbM family methyltransferase